MRRIEVRWVVFLGFLGFTGLCGAKALADERGDELLRKLDTALGKAEDQFYEYQCITREAGKPESRMLFQMVSKGTQFRRVEFLAPGDMKGMRVLVRSVSQMYVYLPAYRRVRRVASHVKHQGFFNTAFSHDEMALVSYSEHYMSTGVVETPTHWKIAAIRRPDSSAAYDKLTIMVSKENKQPTEIVYFDAKGTKLKTETRSDFLCRQEICVPKEIKMVDHTRGDVTSTLVREKWEVNTGVKDSFFTVRALQMAR